MAQRSKTIGGNWKMNLNRQEAVDLAKSLAQGMDEHAVEVSIFPALPHLDAVSSALAGANSRLKVGAQNFFSKPNGAFTGEVSLSMLRDLGCQTVLVGHSERRHVLGEADVLINEKLLAALDASFEVILCVGETLEQRERGQTNAITAGQLNYALAGVPADQLGQLTIAYEPVWAIGTGKTATPADAAAAHAAIRHHLKFVHGEDVAGAMQIQYGGSVKPDNAAELLAQADIDGALVGGASLDADAFLQIIRDAGSV